jgi:hypothetical protein
MREQCGGRRFKSFLGRFEFIETKYSASIFDKFISSY